MATTHCRMSENQIAATHAKTSMSILLLHTHSPAVFRLHRSYVFLFNDSDFPRPTCQNHISFVFKSPFQPFTIRRQGMKSTSHSKGHGVNFLQPIVAAAKDNARRLRRVTGTSSCIANMHKSSINDITGQARKPIVHPRDLSST